jgi:hypothetical protein
MRTYYNRIAGQSLDRLAALILAHESLEAAYAALVAQGQKVSLTGLCQRTQVSGRVAGPFLREQQKSLVAVAPRA